MRYPVSCYINMNTTDVPVFENLGFDSERYIELQKNEILERLTRVNNGKLYLEIGGKLLEDPHASRVLPGFYLDTKIKILQSCQRMISYKRE